MSILRQISNLARHSAIYAISTTLQRLSGFLLLPIYTSFDYIPTQSAFGDYIIVFTFIAFMNFFYLYGMDSAMLRYFFLGKKNRKVVFSSTFNTLLVSSVITTALLIFFSPEVASGLLKSADYSPLIQIAGLILLFDTLGNLPYLILRAEEKSIHFMLFKGLRFTLEMVFNVVYVVFFRLEVYGIFYSSLTASVINFLVMTPIIFRYLTRTIDFTLWKEMLKFGLPLLPNGIAFMTVELIDRLIVPKILGKEALAVYGANYRFGAILMLLILAFRNAWQPFFLKIADQENARKIYARVLTYFVIGAGMITLFCTLFIEDILTFKYWLPFAGDFYILNNQSYWQGISIIPIILSAYCFYGIYVILTPGFYIEKESKYMIIFTGSAAVVNVAANLILLPLLNSFWGAAWATLLSYLTMAITIYVVANRIYPIPIEWGRIAKIFLLASTLMVLQYSFEIHFALRLILMLFSVIFCLFWIIRPGERQAAKAQFARLRG